VADQHLADRGFCEIDLGDDQWLAELLQNCRSDSHRAAAF
jgi:hypothetical protein